MKRRRKNGWFQKLVEAGAKTTFHGKIVRTGGKRRSSGRRSAATAGSVEARSRAREQRKLFQQIAGEARKAREARKKEYKDLGAGYEQHEFNPRRRPAAGNPSKFQECVEEVTAKGKARSPRGVCAAAGRKKYGEAEMRRRAKAARARKRRNPDQAAELDAAAQLSEKFHGRPARRVHEVEEVEHSRDTLAELGRMISVTVWVDDRPYELTFRGVKLAASPDGGQLYFVGNQKLDLAGLRLDRYLPKDHITVGPVETIVYHTSKAFHDFEPVDYVHEFGEEGGELPVLGYDVLSEKFFLTGGSYQVKPEGIVN